jgi:hypothetical protein
VQEKGKEKIRKREEEDTSWKREGDLRGSWLSWRLSQSKEEGAPTAQPGPTWPLPCQNLYSDREENVGEKNNETTGGCG